MHTAVVKFLPLLMITSCICIDAREKPLSPEDARKSFQMEPGLEVQLVAAEPLVIAPVAMSFDEQGRMFVAENRGYPDHFSPPQGRIALLEDKDSDGVFETRHEYAKDLTFPNGVLAWNGGVIVTCAPDVFFFKDTNEDGVADLKKVLLTGFATNGSTQLRVSHPTFAPDGWVYLSGGLSGGKITSPKRPHAPALDIARNEVRFRPETGQVEAVAGKGQFGLTFSDAGRRFTCMNRIHAQEVVLETRYLKRNPNLRFSETMENLPESLEPEPLPGHRPAARIYPISQNLTTADSHAGTFTAACAVLFYGGDAIPEMSGSLFSCDPSANLIHRDLLKKSGATFVARPATPGTEFLASTDDWFRPVNLQTGPDGALYICDMYRRTVEHPVYLPEEVRKRTDFESGRNCGRIWRVKAAGLPHRARRISSNGPDLFNALIHSNIWHRETAQRLLLTAGDLPPQHLGSALQERNSHPGGRARALRVLAQFEQLKSRDIIGAFQNRDPSVRETAVHLSESYLGGGEETMIKALNKMAQDSDPHVRFRTALVLGEVSDRGSVLSTLGEIAAHPESDRWTFAAVLSAAAGVEPKLLQESIRKVRSKNLSAPFLDFVTECSRLAQMTSQARQPPKSVLKNCESNPALEITVWLGWSFEGQKPFTDDGLEHQAAARLAALRNESERIATDQTQPSHYREAAIRFWRLVPDFPMEHIIRFLIPGEKLPLQQAAVHTLLEVLDNRLSRDVLKSIPWNRLSPSIREQLTAGMISRPGVCRELLSQLQNGEFSPGFISAAQRRQLLAHANPEIRAQAVQLFQAADRSTRQEVFEEYKPAADLAGASGAGKEIFRRTCAACHRLDREGVSVGPDLFSIRNQPKTAILLHIIDPDLEIAGAFQNYNLELRDGRSLSGIIVSESDSTVTLKMAGGAEERLERSEVLSLRGSELSMMPQELEKGMSLQDMADLLAFLKGE